MFWCGEADMALEAAQRIVSHTVFCRKRDRASKSHFSLWNLALCNS